MWKMNDESAENAAQSKNELEIRKSEFIKMLYAANWRTVVIIYGSCITNLFIFEP